MIKKYKCSWCNFEFNQDVVYKGKDGYGKHKKTALSTQVKCPNCARLIPTWEKVMIENKHIHIGR